MTIPPPLVVPASTRVREQDIHLRKRRSLNAIDIITAVGCAGGLTASTLYGMSVRSSTFAASDFKTLYASAWCFARGLDAYNIPNLQHVFNNNSVVQPAQWYAHAPVYPWTTLALISPLTALPMVLAAYVAIIVAGGLLACAIAAVMYYASDHLSLGRGWRIAVAVLCVSGPLLGFGMDMGNVSVPASVLCVLAFVLRERAIGWVRRPGTWLPAAALATAVILKPHLAIWCGLGMVLLPERAARSVAVRAAALVVGFTLVVTIVLVACGQLMPQTLSYIHVLSSESAAGSMSAASREALPIVAQITSLQSMLSYWIANSILRNALTFVLLAGAGALMVQRTRSVESERGALLAVASWCSLGMLATYHRAHDATVLILLVPWGVSWIRTTRRAWHVWSALALYCAMSASADFPTVFKWLAALPHNSAIAFILLKQAALSDALLLALLLSSFGYERLHKAMVEPSGIGELRRAA